MKKFALAILAIASSVTAIDIESQVDANVEATSAAEQWSSQPIGWSNGGASKGSSSVTGSSWSTPKFPVYKPPVIKPSFPKPDPPAKPTVIGIPFLESGVKGLLDKLDGHGVCDLHDDETTIEDLMERLNEAHKKITTL